MPNCYDPSDFDDWDELHVPVTKVDVIGMNPAAEHGTSLAERNSTPTVEQFSSSPAAGRIGGAAAATGCPLVPGDATELWLDDLTLDPTFQLRARLSEDVIGRGQSTTRKPSGREVRSTRPRASN